MSDGDHDGNGQNGGSAEQLARVALIISVIALALSILGMFLPITR